MSWPTMGLKDFNLIEVSVIIEKQTKLNAISIKITQNKLYLSFVFTFLLINS